jgi:hypothetical protein
LKYKNDTIIINITTDIKKKGGFCMTTKKDLDISKEMRNLKKILKQIPKDRQAIAQSLYNELEFMQKTLETLREQVTQ